MIIIIIIIITIFPGVVCSVSESGLTKDLVGLGLLVNSSLIRVYPKGARINSSNYNPMLVIIFIFFFLSLHVY